MTARPIIFSEAMVRALLAGAKTQTRRLATSPLRLCQPGDRLYVRETFAEVAEGYLTIFRSDYPDSVPPHFENVPSVKEIKWRPCIHMPRRVSRLTLEVVATHVEPLIWITEEDARAEGVSDKSAYADLWDKLHGHGAWDSNPDVLAVRFTVLPGNVDRLARKMAA